MKNILIGVGLLLSIIGCGSIDTRGDGNITGDDAVDVKKPDADGISCSSPSPTSMTFALNCTDGVNSGTCWQGSCCLGCIQFVPNGSQWTPVACLVGNEDMACGSIQSTGACQICSSGKHCTSSTNVGGQTSYACQ